MKKIPLNPRFDLGVVKRRNRRRMAWTALISMLSITFLLMFVVKDSKIVLLSNFLETIIVCLSSIILGYLGIATMDDNNIMKNSKKQEENKEDKEDKE